MIRLVSAGILLALLNGCASLVYSPALQLPAEKLEKNQVDLAGGVEYLAESRPGIPYLEEEIGSLSLGFSGQIGLGLSNDVSIYGRGWLEAGKPEFEYRYGFSLSVLINKGLTPNSYLVLIPKAGVVYFGSELRGHGAGFSLLYQYQFAKGISIYTGAGMLWGFGFGNKTQTLASQYNYPSNGIGYHFNNGIAWQFWRGLRLTIEIIPTIQLSNYDSQTCFLVPGMLGLGYSF